ncbi:MAG TPA: tetratricopeptide repeat protein [Vicinamibacteria bacterium]|nr:tetratricopeptide repeat protein [Vicinamibacteria bacterium]
MLAAALVVVSACAPAPPLVTVPSEADDYVFPGWTPGELARDEARSLERAWRDVMAGKSAAAEKRLRDLLRKHPGSVPVEAGLGYALLRQGRVPEAARSFASVLARRADYVPALVGAASAALRTGGAEEALTHLRRAAALDSANETVRRRLSEVRLQVTDRRVAAARAAVAAGSTETAVAEYRHALEAAPEMTEARLALADLLVEGGQPAQAAAVLEADPEGGRQVLLRLGEILQGLREYGRALEAYRRVLALDPADEDALRRSREVREATELLQMPEEYRRIPASPTLTRADLAALLMSRVAMLSRLPPRPGKVAIDISGSWARDQIIRALALGLLDVYPNHTFQPGAAVRRGDLATAVQRVLDLAGHPATTLANPTDMSAQNLARYPAARVVGAGLMDLTESGAFEAWRPVTGREAVDVIEGLVRLVGP